MRFLFGFLTAWLLVGVLGMERMAAQTQNAAISGTVTDATGAILAAASVQVRNVGTGISQGAVSDEQGRYRVADLQIGEYEAQASLAGFQTVVHKGITLNVGSQVVVDFSLPVGQAQQTVTVQGEVSAVDTQSTAVGALVESKQMRDLPLNGRNFTQLMTLAPGVTQIPLNAPGGASTFYGNGQKYSIAGSRPSGQAYLLDDQDMTNFWNNGPGAGGLGTALGVEAIAEFQTLTNTYSPAFGGNGAVINASSRPGTNGFHGSAYEFLRNDKLEDRNFFDVQSGAPPYHQNQFGGSVGGPIKKDKIFFFANYEGLRKSQITSAIVTVPDACAHQFLTTATSAGGCGAPVSQNNTPFGTNPAVQSAIRNTMALWPLPNYNQELLTATGAPSETGQAVVLDPLRGHENYVLGRIDYNISAKDTLFVRYVLDYAQRSFTTGIPYWPELDTTRDHFVNIEERRILSPAVANSLHIGFSRTWEDAAVYGSPTVANGAVIPGTITSAGNHPLQFFGPQAGREDGTIATFSGLTAVGASTTLPFYLVPNKFSYGDDVIWTKGAHSVKFGGMATRYRENTWAPFVVGGNWTFPNITAFLQGAASQVQGQVSDVQNPTADATKDYRYWVFDAYLEDQWRVSNKLTLTMGMRYSPTTMISGVRHQMYNLIDPFVPGGAFVPVKTSTASNPSLRNWDPRVGLAWDPFADHKTAVRASFGMFHNVLLSRDLNYWLQPPFLTATQTAAQGLVYPYLFSNLGPGADVVNVPTNGTLSITNGDYYG
ncbi:MAG: TonB-dependent receptor, partial [Acidobacteriia bacterium]|nr:TonB-dependent receptor [Terriglobia bacterium]